MSKKIFLISCGILCLGIILTIFFRTQKQINFQENNNQPLTVSVSIYPLAHIVEKVAGSFVHVQLITPGGIEPHEYEPTPEDLVNIYQSQGVILNGGGLDVWGEKIQSDLKEKNIPVIVMANVLKQEAIQLTQVDAHAGIEQIQFDPHMWLDPVLFSKEVDMVADFLSSLDPAHAADFAGNAALYQKELAALDTAYRRGLENCQVRDIIVSHDAFEYLGSEYGFAIHSIAGISPEDEPSAARLAELTRFIKSKKITTVFFESLVSPKLSETLARETGAQSSVLNPIEGLASEEAQAGKNYDILMKENLEALKKAMVCR